MAELTPEESAWLVKYCMEEPENIRLALAIGQIQPALKKAILNSFLEELSKGIGAELRKRKPSLDSYWNPGEIWEAKWGVCFPMAMEDRIEIHLYYQIGPQDLFIAVPAKSKACPKAERIQPHFEGTGLKLQTSSEQWYRWWFYPTEEHKWLKDLAALSDEQARKAKVEYFRRILADCAYAISQELEE